MRSSLSLSLSATVTAGAMLLPGCSTSEYPNPILTFNMGQEDGTYEGVERFDVEQVKVKFDGGQVVAGKSTRIYRGSSLPESIDLGDGEDYFQYVATGYDADDVPLAIGRSVPAQPASLLGSEVPLFIGRTDRASRPTGNFALAPTEYPVASVLSSSLIWYMDDVSSSIKTDSYNFAYWDQVDPLEQYQSIPCLKSPCNLTNLVVVGYYYAIAIASDWALFINARESAAVEYDVPKGLSSWADVAGGRTLQLDNNSGLIAGATRLENPTRSFIGFTYYGEAVVFELNQARAGAALLAEDDFGVVMVGGSSKGKGVEVLSADNEEFVELDYPADPVVGAALVIEDESHLLRVGGLTEDGKDAPTVRIDMECEADCAYEKLPKLDLPLYRAQSYYDKVTGETLLVGEDADGLTQVFRYQPDGFVEVTFPKSQKRVRASALELPNQQLAVIGGTDPNDPDDSRTAVSIVAF